MRISHLVLPLLLWPGVSLAANLKIVSEAWAPYIFEHDGQLQGVDYETVQQVFSQLGYHIEWELTPWKRAMLSVTSGRADAILDILPDAERRRQLIFPSEHLSINDSVLFYSRRHPHPYARLEDLRGLTIGVAPGYLYGNSAFVTADYFTREPAPTVEANLLKLRTQRIDLALIDRRAGLYVRQQLGLEQQIGFDPQPVGSGKLFLAFHRGAGKVELSHAFSTQLKRFKQSQEYQQILSRYRSNEANK
ncbi:MAG: transporter substrate-binding domain-containing protein [Halopseudomonas sp.]|uniref:substrate-binding periplasmic protein n=1 Tax=Halopseudomonas sp. TaxID=2901191 RepID=UPI003001DAC7